MPSLANFRANSKNKSVPKPIHILTTVLALFLLSWFISGILNYYNIFEICKYKPLLK
jgi:hypothetical protein